MVFWFLLKDFLYVLGCKVFFGTSRKVCAFLYEFLACWSPAVCFLPSSSPQGSGFRVYRAYRVFRVYRVYRV